MISDDIREMARSEVGTEVLAYDLGGKRWVVVEWSPGVVGYPDFGVEIAP